MKKETPTFQSPVSDYLRARLNSVCDILNECECEVHAARGNVLAPDEWRWTERVKYVYLNVGTSGAFLVDKQTGELYNIAGYGKSDLNKKKKADLGNIYTCNVVNLHRSRVQLSPLAGDIFLLT